MTGGQEFRPRSVHTDIADCRAKAAAAGISRAST